MRECEREREKSQDSDMTTNPMTSHPCGITIENTRIFHTRLHLRNILNGANEISRARLREKEKGREREGEGRRKREREREIE